ncbi:MAG: hypothetical protein Q8P67_21095 [archaeon]|nr:hypothetical protein [archaeon]
MAPRIDPYAVLRLDGQELTTKSKGSKPLFGDISTFAFNETFDFIVHAPNPVLNITLWNKDLFDASKNQFLGHASAMPTLSGREESLKLKLKPRTKSDRVYGGTLTVKMIYVKRLEIGAPLLLSKTHSELLLSAPVSASGEDGRLYSPGGSTALLNTRYTPRHKKGLFKNKKKSRLIWGKPLASDVRSADLVSDCINYLFFPSALRTAGLFRIPAARLDVDALRNDWEYGAPLERAACPDPHVVAGLLMSYLLALPEPLIPTDNYSLIIPTEDLADNELERLTTLRKMLVSIPAHNFAILAKLMSYLASLANYSQENQMTSKNIAICFGPVLLRCRDADESPQQAVRDTPIIIRIIASLIEHYAFFFEHAELTEESLARALSEAGAVNPPLDIISPRGMLEQGLFEAPSPVPHPEPLSLGSPTELEGTSSDGPDVESSDGSSATSKAAPKEDSPSCPSATIRPSTSAEARPSTTSRVLTTTPAKFFNLQGIVLTAIRTVRRYMQCLLNEMADPASASFSASHVEPTSRLIDAILATLESAAPGTIAVLFQGPVPSTPVAADPAATRALVPVAEKILSLIAQNETVIQDEALLLEPDKAAACLVQNAHVVKEIGKLLDNYQAHVRSITDAADVAAAFQRLRHALLSALQAIRVNQIPRVRTALSEADSLESAVATTTVVRGLESALLATDAPVWEHFVSICQQVPNLPVGPELQIEKLRTLQEASLVGFERISAALDQINAAIRAASTKPQLTSIAQKLRAVSLALDQYINSLFQAKEKARAAAASLAARHSPQHPTSSSLFHAHPTPLQETSALSLSNSTELIEQPLVAARQKALGITQELQSILNNLRLEIETAPPPLLITLSRIASVLSKITASESIADRRAILTSLIASPHNIVLPSDISPAVVQSLREKSSSMFDEIRAHYFRERRFIPKARTIDELDTLVQHVTIALNVISHLASSSSASSSSSSSSTSTSSA